VRDIRTRIENTFKDAVATACIAQGIDHKTEAGWAVGGGGNVGPVIEQGKGIMAFAPTWTFTLELRSLLLGQTPVGGSLPIHDVVPGDDDIRKIATRLVADVDAARKAQFKGDA